MKPEICKTNDQSGLPRQSPDLLPEGSDSGAATAPDVTLLINEAAL
jgi:hypothetical protein